MSLQVLPIFSAEVSTLLTPCTFSAISLTWSIACRLVKVPLSTTTPCFVVTLTLKPLLRLSAAISDFTLVVIQLSDATRLVVFTTLCVSEETSLATERVSEETSLATERVSEETSLAADGVLRSSSTRFTPSTLRAIVSAVDFAFEPGAEPVSVTIPLLVVTLISACFRRSTPINLDFTLAVIAVSVIAAPTVPLWEVLDSSDSANATALRPNPAAMPTTMRVLRNDLISTLSVLH